MKVLHVFLFLSVRVGGGTSNFLCKLANAQQRHGHEVSIYTGDYGYDTESSRSLEGVNLRVFKSWLNHGFYVMPGMISTVEREIVKFDVVHLHLYRSFQNIVIRHFAVKYGVPYVMDAHGSLARFSRKKKVKALFDRLFGEPLLRDATRCIGETDMGVQEYADYGVNPEKVVRISPPFPIEDFAELPPKGMFRRQFGFSEESRIIMFLGRIHWIKGIDILAQVFAKLADRRCDVLLVVVGPDDGYRSTLEKLIHQLGIEGRVSFTGFLGGTQRLSALVDADVMVQTSRYEQGAWAPLEAVLCGTPIVVSDNSGAGEDVRRLNAGYIAEFDHPDDLLRKIEHVLDRPKEALQKTLAAKAYIETHLSMENCIQEYDRLYETCLRSNSRLI